VFVLAQIKFEHPVDETHLSSSLALLNLFWQRLGLKEGCISHFLPKLGLASHQSQSASNALLSTCPCTVDRIQKSINIIGNAIEKLI
jgi:hypothetical protein